MPYRNVTAAPIHNEVGLYWFRSRSFSRLLNREKLPWESSVSASRLKSPHRRNHERRPDLLHYCERLSLFAGLAIVLTVLALNLAGDGLCDMQ